MTLETKRDVTLKGHEKMTLKRHGGLTSEKDEEMKLERNEELITLTKEALRKYIVVITNTLTMTEDGHPSPEIVKARRCQEEGKQMTTMAGTHQSSLQQILERGKL